VPTGARGIKPHDDAATPMMPMMPSSSGSSSGGGGCGGCGKQRQ